jgi:SlyX protein
MTDQERIDELETRVAFQEDTLDKLNSIVSSQEIEIQKLTRMMKVFSQQVKNISIDMPTSRPEDEPPPPHY